MNGINLKGVTAESVTSILLQVLALINAGLEMFGYHILPIDNSDISAIVSLIFAIVISAYNTWKNRNLTKASQKAQEITDMIKSGEVLIEQVDYVIEQFKKDYVTNKKE